MEASDKTKIVDVKGMHCDHCVKNVTSALGKIEGLKNIEVNLNEGTAIFEEEVPVDEAVIRDAINQIGFEAGDVRVYSKS
jgi:copper chaperone CopZ